MQRALLGKNDSRLSQRRMERIMKKFQKLQFLPLGSIRADGFLKDQLMRGKDGMAGNLYKLEPQAIADPYVKDTIIERWPLEEQLGWQAEISGTYWTGYIMHAFVLGDTEMIAVAEKWVDDMLKLQCENGYLGIFRHENDNIYDDKNAGGGTCAYRALLAFYEATGREDVLAALHRALLWFCDNWAGEKKTIYSGQCIIDVMIPVYHLTGDERLVDFSVDYMEFLAENSLFSNSYRDMMGDLLYLSDHSVGVAYYCKLPARVYSATGEKKYLDAAINRMKQAHKKIIHPTGGFACAAEYAAPVGSTTEYEYCSFTYGLQSHAFFCSVTGEPSYGDDMETVFYNAAQGARKKDERAIAYLTAPNQIYASKSSSTFAGDCQIYAPCYNVACCPVNSVLIVPDFIRSMLMRDDDDNIYVAAYGPCTLNYRGISLTEKTLYPFRNKVTFELGSDKHFALNLKIPSWATGYTITVNGEVANAQADGGYAKIERDWKRGDAAEITFETRVEIMKVDDSDYAAKYPLAIKYGPLIFSYHIPERWRPYRGNPITPLPEDWSFFEVHPLYRDADVEDFFEQLAKKREQFSWNIVLDEELSPEDVTVEEIDTNGYVWEDPPLKLHTHCYKALYLNALYQCRTFEPFGAYQYVTEKLPLTLEPYGCTNLRITYFSKADLKKK